MWQTEKYTQRNNSWELTKFGERYKPRDSRHKSNPKYDKFKEVLMKMFINYTSKIYRQ
jgi:hypothetical protein